MNKQLTTIAFIVFATFASHSHAGWWDNLFSSDEEATVETPKTPAATTTTKTTTPTEAQQVQSSLSLIDMISSQAGVSSEQATGGLGAIFQTAKNNLSADDFGSIASAIPGMDLLLGAVPSGEGSGVMGGLLANAGKTGELLTWFNQLGLTPGHITSFVGIIKQYFSKTNQPQLTDTLMKGIDSFL